MGTLPDELFLGAGSVGGRRPHTQDLLNGLQHCALATAVLARHKVNVGAAYTARQDLKSEESGEKVAMSGLHAQQEKMLGLDGGRMWCRQSTQKAIKFRTSQKMLGVTLAEASAFDTRLCWEVHVGAA